MAPKHKKQPDAYLPEQPAIYPPSPWRETDANGDSYAKRRQRVWQGFVLGVAGVATVVGIAHNRHVIDRTPVNIPGVDQVQPHAESSRDVPQQPDGTIVVDLPEKAGR